MDSSTRKIVDDRLTDIIEHAENIKEIAAVELYYDLPGDPRPTTLEDFAQQIMVATREVQEMVEQVNRLHETTHP